MPGSLTDERTRATSLLALAVAVRWRSAPRRAATTTRASSGSADTALRQRRRRRSRARSPSTARRPSARSPRRPRSCSTRRTPTSRSRSASPAPAAASRSSAPARPTSPTPRAPIKDDEEAPLCEKGGVAYTEVQIANDGIAVVDQQGARGRLHDHRRSSSSCGTRARRSRTLTEIDPELPDAELSLYGPGTDSGTFDFFTDAINGEEGVSREDYEASEDDNQLVTGVAGDDGRPRLLRLLLLRGRRGQAEPVGVDGGGGTASSRRPRRSRTAPTSRCRARCSCTRARRRCSAPR